MKDNAAFCPACGTPSVDYSGLAGGGAYCKVCSWEGPREELMQVPLEHEFASQEEMLIRFVRQVATVIAQSSAAEVGRVLLQWGFLDKKTLAEELPAYIRSMAVGAAKSVIETRHHLEIARANKLRAKNAS